MVQIWSRNTPKFRGYETLALHHVDVAIVIVFGYPKGEDVLTPPTAEIII